MFFLSSLTRFLIPSHITTTAVDPSFGRHVRPRTISHNKPCPSLAARANEGFDPKSSAYMAVYFGRTNASQLERHCNNPNIDIVILGFLRAFDGPGDHPVIDFGTTCQTMSRKSNATANISYSCRDIGQQISKCQKLGKKVFMGIGGSASNTTFESRDDAVNAADAIWESFGPESANSTAFRPF